MKTMVGVMILFDFFLGLIVSSYATWTGKTCRIHGGEKYYFCGDEVENMPVQWTIHLNRFSPNYHGSLFS